MVDGTAVPVILGDGITMGMATGILDTVFSRGHLFSGRLTITGLIIPTRPIFLHPTW